MGGWGGDDDVSFACTHVTCYALDVSCTCTHVTCYASHGEGWVGDDDVSFTCPHVTCYALDVSGTCTHVTCYGLGNQSLNVALKKNWPVFPTKCKLQSGTLKLDRQGLKR